MVLTAMEKAVAAAPRMHRHRLEHASIVNDDILARSKALEIVLAPHSYIYEKGPMIEAYGEEQRLTVDQALYVYTMGSAFATFEENQKGSITPGKYADFTFLSADPHDVAPGAISMIDVEATYSDGVKRFQK